MSAAEIHILYCFTVAGCYLHWGFAIGKWRLRHLIYSKIFVKWPRHSNLECWYSRVLAHGRCFTLLFYAQLVDSAVLIAALDLVICGQVFMHS